MEQERILEANQISKAFPGVQALDCVSFNLNHGEVHALVGENGAGKSTLMKILSGVHLPDDGFILLRGEAVEIRTPKSAQEYGISIVHQELNLFPNLTVAENIFGGDMPVKGLLGLEDRDLANQTASEYLKKFQSRIKPQTPVHRLSIAQQQIVEISKAISQQASILILDEPTSALTEHESDLLFKIIRQLRDDGMGIIYISHRLEEIFDIADRVTVLRDGKLVGTEVVENISIDRVIRMMVGRDLKDVFDCGARKITESVLRVSHLCHEDHYSDICFELHAGEILGMAGLIGAGRSEVGLSIFGALPASGGKIYVREKEVNINSPQRAMDLGIAYISENRQKDGLFFNMGVRENISVSHLDEYSKFGFMSYSQEAEAAEALVQQLRIQTPGVEQKVLNLSGGNQQKVVLGRWLAIQPEILIVDEPTRGIDVGAKMEIYSLLNQLAERGVAILLISSEMLEILGLSDRIIVMHEGKITGELLSSQASEEKIMALATSQDLTLEPIGGLNVCD